MLTSFTLALTFPCSKNLVNAYYLILFVLDRESIEHDDTVKPDTTEDQIPKIPLYPKPDVIHSRKNAAVRKDKKKQQEKHRLLGSTDYSPLPIDKHEPEFVSCVTQQLQ